VSGGGDWVVVGRVGRPHGLDGAFVAEQPSERLAAGLEVWVDDEPAKVVSARRVGGGRLALRLDRPVERGAELRVPRASLPRPDEGAYYVFELVGLAVVEPGGRALGTVARVEPYPANDVLELDSGLLLPLVEDCVLDVDLEQRRIVVAEGFADPA
jgi:16S rRNA processing protein RimM